METTQQSLRNVVTRVHHCKTEEFARFLEDDTKAKLDKLSEDANADAETKGQSRIEKWYQDAKKRKGRAGAGRQAAKAEIDVQRRDPKVEIAKWHGERKWESKENDRKPKSKLE